MSEHHAARWLESGALDVAALDELWAVRQWKICSHDLKSLPARVRLLLDHLSSRERRRESHNVVSLPGAARIAKYTAVRVSEPDSVLR